MKVSIMLWLLLVTGGAMASPPIDEMPSDLSKEIRHYFEPVATPRYVVKALKAMPASPAHRPRYNRAVSIAEIINLAEKVWHVIEKNQPVLNVSYKYANALPKGVAGPEELEGFSAMQYRSYRLYGKNLYGITVYDVTFTVVHRYGGRYKGQGYYLESVTVLPHNVEVLWGYTVDLQVDRISTVNVGSQERPVASLLMGLEFKVSTVIKKAQYRNVFEFRGDSPIVRMIE